MSLRPLASSSISASRRSIVAGPAAPLRVLVTRSFAVKSATPPSRSSTNATTLDKRRTFSTTSVKMSDDYSKQTEEQAPLATRVEEVNAIIKKVGTSMLTTVGTDGKSLHSRAMRAASTDKLVFAYIYDNTSHKDDEIQQDSHVNISYCEPTGGDWISIAGTATTTNDRDAVAKVYSAQIKAWFADKGDGVHDGSESDPRVSVMHVKPVEIRYYTRQQTLVGQAVNIATSIFSRDVATPGKIRTITGAEVASL